MGITVALYRDFRSQILGYKKKKNKIPSSVKDRSVVSCTSYRTGNGKMMRGMRWHGNMRDL